MFVSPKVVLYFCPFRGAPLQLFEVAYTYVHQHTSYINGLEMTLSDSYYSIITSLFESYRSKNLLYPVYYSSVLPLNS